MLGRDLFITNYMNEWLYSNYYSRSHQQLVFPADRLHYQYLLWQTGSFFHYFLLLSSFSFSIIKMVTRTHWFLLGLYYSFWAVMQLSISITITKNIYFLFEQLSKIGCRWEEYMNRNALHPSLQSCCGIQKGKNIFLIEKMKY